MKKINLFFIILSCFWVGCSDPGVNTNPCGDRVVECRDTSIVYNALTNLDPNYSILNVNDTLSPESCCELKIIRDKESLKSLVKFHDNSGEDKIPDIDFCDHSVLAGNIFAIKTISDSCRVEFKSECPAYSVDVIYKIFGNSTGMYSNIPVLYIVPALPDNITVQLHTEIYYGDTTSICVSDKVIRD